MLRSLLPIVTAACGLLAAQAYAGDYSSAASYNSPYGMSAGQENQPVNASLRDANGNLTVVNGQFTSSAMSQQSGAQQMSALGSSSVSTGVGSGAGSGGLFGAATAVGNALNVVTVGNNNTVVVTAEQNNSGNQTANVSVNGH